MIANIENQKILFSIIFDKIKNRKEQKYDVEDIIYCVTIIYFYKNFLF